MASAHAARVLAQRDAWAREAAAADARAAEVHAAAADLLRGGVHEGDCVSQEGGPCLLHLEALEQRAKRLRRALVAVGVPVPELKP
jgi:hypothetical protein